MTNNLKTLMDKIDKEYNTFITGIQNGDVATAIELAYDIVWKDNINEYCQNELNHVNNPLPDLTDEDIKTLISAENALDDIYCAWCDMHLSDPRDIHWAIMTAVKYNTPD